ncbi:hypothetical protein DIZ81_02115 [Legionella taurinensis]|uniref:OTU domain-containing protein n=1 Tax=Legionella taurinensis TaxID=70611 RepID=A0A3A5L2Y1_9GAMM|nr:hypothetical protein [Legionella taurinensis]MDX1836334.1 hypothetical protein [Legionella taurinensis]PUT41915.1 hypothetical protein DB744_02120 [Legionella taurinensis]PUT44704.1 hypothetical protein DB746_02120 [Legionella taurinensis]PUT48024.1 hypothetical protein DB743_00280 [Legionella taurinensis]PUT48838.1 hypothetical protein DB745_02120 [Legionella taurinensis]
MSTSSFFRDPARVKPNQGVAPTYSKVVKRQEPAFVDVGGHGDCGFRAIAAALVDKLLTKNNFPMNARSRGIEDLFKRLLARHFKLFPMKHGSGLKTVTERVRDLVDSPARMVDSPVKMAEFIDKLAYTLRQIAVDEMVTYPENYRGAFVDNTEGTSPAEMRQQSTWIDETALAALANALHIPITVKMVEPNKEIPAMKYHGQAESQGVGEVVIQLQGQHYIPRVSQPERFQLVANQPVPPIEPNPEQSKPDPEMPAILARIEAEDKRLLAEFDYYKSLLANMVQYGNLNKDQLIAMYVKGLGSSDYLRGRIRQVGLEYGNEHFFAEITSRAQNKPAIIALNRESNESQVVNELIHAIARAVSIGQLDSKLVLDMIENDNQENTRSSISAIK